MTEGQIETPNRCAAAAPLGSRTVRENFNAPVAAEAPPRRGSITLVGRCDAPGSLRWQMHGVDSRAHCELVLLLVGGHEVVEAEFHDGQVE